MAPRYAFRITKVLHVLPNHPSMQPGGAPETYALELHQAMLQSEGLEPVLVARTGAGRHRAGSAFSPARQGYAGGGERARAGGTAAGADDLRHRRGRLHRLHPHGAPARSRLSGAAARSALLGARAPRAPRRPDRGGRGGRARRPTRRAGRGRRRDPPRRPVERPDRGVRPEGQLADERRRHREPCPGVRRAGHRALRVRLLVLALRRPAAGHARRAGGDRGLRRVRRPPSATARSGCWS